jgi:lipopolysaccharide transport system ATP-binding protein
VTDIAIRLDHVRKKFSRGERHDSLRDLVPALARRLMGKAAPASELKSEEFWALDDISFEIRKGEAIGIIGHNGAGKSTMLKHLSGIMKPTSGTIAVNGRLSALIEVGAGFHHDLTGRENIFLNGVIMGMSRREIQTKFDEIVDFSGLANFIDTPVKRYSSGMYARLGFSVAAHMDPDILVIDEVLSVGDWLFQRKGLEKMRSVARSGATVIFVSHNLRAMSDLCHRSLLLKSGRLLMDGPTSEIIHAYMEQVKTARAIDANQVATIEEVRVLEPSGTPRLDFESGGRAIVEVKVRALRPTGRFACVLYVHDDSHYQMFNTSTQRLGLPALDLEAGEVRVCRFELDLHLGAGTFGVGVNLFRHEVGMVIDQVGTAATLLIRSPIDTSGAVHLYPRAEILPSSSASV